MSNPSALPVRVSLTGKNPIPETTPLFPADYYEIPDISCFQDTGAADRWALKQLSAFAGRQAEFYINGGLAIEMLSALRAMELLAMPVRVFHWDSSRAAYIPQEFCWHPSQLRPSDTVKFMLCQNRHCMPESRTIFHFQDIPDGKHFDFQWQEQQAEASLASFRGQRAEIYLTGLKTLQVSVLNAASRLEIPVTWLHYDYDTEAYFPQNMDASIEMGNNHDKKHSASDGILP